MSRAPCPRGQQPAPSEGAAPAASPHASPALRGAAPADPHRVLGPRPPLLCKWPSENLQGPRPQPAPPAAQTPPAAEMTWAQPGEGLYFAHIQKRSRSRERTLAFPSSRHGFPHGGLRHCPETRARTYTRAHTLTHTRTDTHSFLCQDQCCHCKPGKRLQGDQVPALCELLSCSLHPPLTRKPNRTSFFFPEKPSTAII